MGLFSRDPIEKEQKLIRSGTGRGRDATHSNELTQPQRPRPRKSSSTRPSRTSTSRRSRRPRRPTLSATPCRWVLRARRVDASGGKQAHTDQDNEKQKRYIDKLATELTKLQAREYTWAGECSVTFAFAGINASPQNTLRFPLA